MRSNIKNQYVYNNFIIFTLLLYQLFYLHYEHLNNSQSLITDAIDYLWPALTYMKTSQDFAYMKPCMVYILKEDGAPNISHFLFTIFINRMKIYYSR